MTVLANRYRLGTPIYNDNDVVVYEAHDQVLNRAVTLELLHANHTADSAYIQRLLDKGRRAALINLPHVAALYDQSTLDGRPFLVLEAIAGPTLQAAAPLTGEQAARLIEALAETIAAATARQQPVPVMTSATIHIGADERVQILDLGLAQTTPNVGREVQALGRVLLAAIQGGESYNVAPLHALAEQAIAGRIPTVEALLHELKGIEQQANRTTTMMPRVTPTMPLPDSYATAPVDDDSAALSAPPTFRRKLPHGALLGVGALLIVLLAGGLVLRNRSGTAAPTTGPTASSVASGATSSAAAPAGSTSVTGVLYIVATNGGQPLAVRTGPGLSFERIASLPNGSTVEVIEGPRTADGFNWVRIHTATVDGWSVREALRKQ